MPILLLCQILNVSRSGFYKWVKHTPPEQQKENDWLMDEIQDIFKEFNSTFGYRRITMVINRRYKKEYDPNRIRRLMIRLGLKSFIRRSNGYSTKTGYVNIEENTLNREFSAEKPNEKWVTDITHMKYGFGKKAYLSAIKDLYDGSIVAYQVGRYNDNPLVMDTIKSTIKVNPDAAPLIHSDRGSQYTSKKYRFITTDSQYVACW